jgi:glycosyltransferase involved in cell wall biosynthesis
MTQVTPRISAVMLARDERENIERCFSSLWDAVDEIVLVMDTRSRDGTLSAARNFAAQRGEPDKLVVGRFKWCEDWAAARNYADSLASGDWLLNLDIDQTPSNAVVLRELVADCDDETVAFRFRHFYPGAPRRQRPPEVGFHLMLARSNAGAWEGIVDEKRMLGKGVTIVDVPPERCEMAHHRAGHSYSKLQARRARKEPNSPYGLLVRAQQALAAGKRERAISLLQECVEKSINTDELPHDFGALILRQLCWVLADAGRLEEARSVARSLIRRGFRGDGNTRLAEIAFATGDFRAALRYAQRGIKFAKPNEKESFPNDHIITPSALAALAHLKLGQERQALMRAREVLALQPDHALMAPLKQRLLAREPVRTTVLLQVARGQAAA